MTIDELNKLKKEATEDLFLTEENCLKKTLEIPNLYQKYLSIFVRESLILKRKKVALDKLYGDRFRFYREKYERDLNKGEIEFYIDSDEEYSSKNLEYQIQESICNYLQEITQRMKNLSFDVKNFIELRIFLAGGK